MTTPDHSTLRGRRIAVLIPCRNERETVSGVVHDFRRALPDAEVHVFDNASTDGTGAAARMAGAQVHLVETPGKGRVVREMFRRIDADAYILVDGDDTYDAARAPEMLIRLFDGGLDMVTATRSRDPEAYTKLRLAGNTLLTEMATAALGQPVTDLLSGYRALSRRFVKSFPARSDGFEVETEMTFFAASQRMPSAELPTQYKARPPTSRSNLRAIPDGARIFRTLVRLAATRHSSRVLRHHLARSVGLALLLCVPLTAVLLGVNWLWVQGDPQPMLDAVATSYTYEPTSIETSFEKFNDCLITIMATLRRPSAWESAVTAERVYRVERPQRPCDALRQIATGPGLQEEYVRVPYHQYWIGQRTLVQGLLPRMGVGGLRRFFLGLTLGLLAAGVVLSLWLARRRASSTVEPERALAFFALFVCLLLFYGSVRQGASFTSAPANAAIYLLLLGGLLRPLGALPWPARCLLISAFAAWQAYMALMFGTIALGLAAVLFVAALDPSKARPLTLEDRRPSGSFALVLESGAVYVAAALGTLLAHVAVADLVYEGSVVRRFVDMLAYRVTGDPRTTLGPELDALFRNNDPSYGRLLERMDARLDLLGFGFTWGGRLLVALALLTLAATAVQLVRRMGTLPRRNELFGLLLSGAVVPCWFILFLEHTQTHARVMVRLWAWPIGCTAAILVLLALHRRTAGHGDERPGR